jgi:small subunit ribosomal protein S19e
MLGETQQTFFTVKDLSAQEFIHSFAQYLKKNNLIERPAWADFVKLATSISSINSGNELAPIDEDWIYYRVASLARKIYLRPHTGVRLLSHIYGGLKRGNCASESHDHASTKIIRWGLQQLEKQKLIKKDKKGNGLKINSRIISDDGRRTLNRIATEYLKNKK